LTAARNFLNNFSVTIMATTTQRPTATDIFYMTRKQRKQLKQREERELQDRLAAEHKCECMCDCGYDCDCECTCQEDDPRHYDPEPPADWYPSAVETDEDSYAGPRATYASDADDDADTEDFYISNINRISTEDAARSYAKFSRANEARMAALAERDFQDLMRFYERRAILNDTKPACTLPTTKSK